MSKLAAGRESRWHKLFNSFKNKKREGNAPSDFSLKHSHNCANSRVRVGVSNMKGYKKNNQDRCTAFSYLEADPELAFFAVYDGHGGTGVANYLKDHLHEFILSQEEYTEGDVPEAILKSFLAVDSELKTYGNATELTGSTATCVLIKHGDLIVANLGDGRAVASVGGVCRPLTQDHNTSNPRERERVTAMGGVIKDNRVGGVLIPTRSFGDFLLKSEMDKPPWKQVISPVPQIEQFKIDTSWEFLIVATDGVWDAVTNNEALNFVKSKIDNKYKDKLVLSSICEEILDTCCKKTVEKYGKNCCDNMTVILILFDHADRSETGSSVVSSIISR